MPEKINNSQSQSEETEEEEVAQEVREKKPPRPRPLPPKEPSFAWRAFMFILNTIFRAIRFLCLFTCISITTLIALIAIALYQYGHFEVKSGGADGPWLEWKWDINEQDWQKHFRSQSYLYEQRAKAWRPTKTSIRNEVEDRPHVVQVPKETQTRSADVLSDITSSDLWDNEEDRIRVINAIGEHQLLVLDVQERLESIRAVRFCT